jgi:hypothetical protein
MQVSAPPNVSGYAASVRAAVAALPKSFGEWTSADAELPVSAVKLLRPNASLQRQYRNALTGESVTLLLVHCGDERDMEGHYPPNCYPSQGYVLLRQEPASWCGGRVNGSLYTFEGSGLAGSAGEWVADAFVVRGQGTQCTMADMRRATRRGDARYFGAAQVQVVVEARMTPERRDALIEQFMGACGPVFDVLENREKTK